MNLHMPQDIEAESELLNLAAVPFQIISPSNNASIIGIYQDSMLGSYRFTRKDIQFTPKEMMNLLMMFSKVNMEKFKGKKDISNFDILSQILPPFSLKVKNKQYDSSEDPKLTNNIIEIKNGEYLRGQLDKSLLGAGTKGLIHRICNDYGNMASADFIDDLQNIITEYMKTSSFSVGISDLISDTTTNTQIIDTITNKKNDVKELIDQIQLGIFENNSGKSNQEEFEMKVNNILNQASADAGKIGLKSLSKENRFVIMVNAGSKGSELNISQMISCVGQQNVEGKRIPYGFDHRTLPHFTKFDDSSSSRGFVENSYINGLTPQEVFFHAMGGRIGLIDTAVKTSTTGYIQRRLIKGLEDLMVHYDMTIRNNKNKIIQFTYGGDNIDTVKVENQEIGLVSKSVQEIYEHFNLVNVEMENKKLSIVFTKPTITKIKKQLEKWNEKCKIYTDFMIEHRNLIIKNIFKNKEDKVVRVPVAFNYLIENVMGNLNIHKNSIVDITLLECMEMIEECFENLEKIYFAPPSLLFKVLFFYYLSPKNLLYNKRFNKTGMIMLLETIALNYKRAIVAPGEMVGLIAAQSIGEPTTQMSCVYGERIKLIEKNKITREIKCVSDCIGNFCDNLIQQYPEYTFSTGHMNSVETLLEKTEKEYYIVGVNNDETVSWNKISHVSRHPVNGDLIKVTTKSGRQVTTTLSHSHLIRVDNSVQPIQGKDLCLGNRIPVSRYIPQEFVTNSYKGKTSQYNLDETFGKLIGIYLATKELHFTTLYDKHNLKEFIVNDCIDGLPNFVFTSSLIFQKELLHNYFNKKMICMSNKVYLVENNSKLLRDIALLLNYFGVFSTIIANKLIIYTSHLSIFLEEIGSIHSKNIIKIIEKNTTELNIDNVDNINGLQDIITSLCDTLNITLDISSQDISREYLKDFIDLCDSYNVPEKIQYNLDILKQAYNSDVVWDEIVHIEQYSPPETDYVYDFTVPGNQTFMLGSGIIVHNTLNTFHFAGVSSKSNVTRGVPRIEEILSLSSEPKNSSLTIYLNEEDETDKQKANSIMYMLEHTKLQEIVISTEICFDPLEDFTNVQQDKLLMEQYVQFESMIEECNQTSISEETGLGEKSKWIIRMEMNAEMMLEKNITMDDVHFALKNYYPDEISCVYSDYNADKLIFRIRMNNIVKESQLKSAKKQKINPLDQTDKIYILKNFQDQLLNSIVLKGFKNINKVILRKIKDNLVEELGTFKKKEIWVLDTVGTNLLDILALDYIDYRRTFSNDIIEIFNVLGIEAARQTIYNELLEVIEFDSTYINSHHLSLLCDRMTFATKMISIFRHGINNDNIGPIAKASFEETPEMFLKAAKHAELDTLRGVSANIMCGQEGYYGTSSFQIILDMSQMKDNITEDEYEEANEKIDIDEAFDKVKTEKDGCEISSLKIINNVANISYTIKEDTGMNDKYELDI
jgi:DNA-directed RNA polymerase beta' subunit